MFSYHLFSEVIQERLSTFWKSGQITICLSQPVFDEYMEVLRRLGLQSERELEEFVGLFARGFHVLYTANTPALHVVNKDPDDNKFIECAVALRAGFIISGDKALTTMKNYMGIKICNPKEFLDRFPLPLKSG